MTDTERPDYEPTPEQQAQWNALDRDWRQVIPDPTLRHLGIGTACSLLHVIIRRGLPDAYELTANLSNDTLRRAIAPLLCWYLTSERHAGMTDEEIDEEVSRRFGDAGSMLLALLEDVPDDLSALGDDGGTIDTEEAT